MMDFSGLPDQAQPEAGGDLLSGLPDTNAGTLRKQYRSTARAPDTAAKVLDLSAKSGLPRVTVERNQQFAERKASEPDWDALRKHRPGYGADSGREHAICSRSPTTIRTI